MLARGGGPEPERPAASPAAPAATAESPTPTPTGTPTPAPTPKPPSLTDLLETRGRHLAVGITEPNANFISPAGGVAPPFARWRDALARMQPAVYRLMVYWPAIQPSPDAPADLGAVNGGCMRTIGPCAPFAGIRDQLRALAARQRQGGWEGMVVITGTPAWAARPPSGCERRRIGPTNRMPRTDALGAYRALVTSILAAARAEGATLRYWAPWNEPNHPYSSSPQRASCSGAAPSVSAGPYVEVTGALRTALRRAPGVQRYVVGELATMTRRLPITTTAHEFLAALPASLVCGAAAYTQHYYVGGEDILGDEDALLRAKHCAHPLPFWITETGAGAPHAGQTRTAGPAAERERCRELDGLLRRWYRDPRITAAIQYTLREDDVFPTGLVTTDLSRAYPALREWQRWGLRARPAITAPPPRRPAC